MTGPRPLALITGASRGIGRAIALDLARTHEIIGTYRSDRSAAETLTREIGAQMVSCDLTSREDRARLVARLPVERPIDLLVNNAGMAPRDRRDMLEATEESFDEVLATNLKGPHFLTQALASRMVAAGSGRIVFITSISAYAASVNRAEYCISKAGLSMVAQLWAVRLASTGVTVFEVRPGVIRTDMIATVRDRYEARAAEISPQGRLGNPDDVARVVRAIAEGYLDYSTGQVIEAGGGFHLRSL